MSEVAKKRQNLVKKVQKTTRAYSGVALGVAGKADSGARKNLAGIIRRNRKKKSYGVPAVLRRGRKSVDTDKFGVKRVWLAKGQ